VFLLFQLFPSPTTGAIPSEPFNWMGTGENLQAGVKDEQRQYTDFTFQTAAASVPETGAGAARQAASFPQSSSMLMAPLVSDEHTQATSQTKEWQSCVTICASV